MTHLLGRQDCVDSLRRDLTDLQGTVFDVFSRTGPIRSPSWKFPDKMSCNVDIVSLLEQYDSVEEDDELNKHSHVVLLELVIDRLVLLLQCFNAHAELMLRSKNHGTASKPSSTSASIGLVVKSYWNNLVQLGRACHQFQGGRPTEKPGETSRNLQKGVADVNSCSSAALSFGSQSSLSSVAQLSSCRRGSVSSVQSTGCQTVSLSLVPCDACATVQSSLRTVSDTLAALCQSQSLPSSLARFLEAVDDWLEGPLRAADVAQWATEQRRDLNRLGKHLTGMQVTAETQKERLSLLEDERKSLREKVEKVEGLLVCERIKHKADQGEAEQRLKEVQRGSDEMVDALQTELEAVRKSLLSLEENNSKLLADLHSQMDNIHTLERHRAELQQETKSRQMELNERCSTLESELSEGQMLLEKERAKYSSVCRQQEAMQEKQRALLGRVDSLVRECEELQENLAENEEARLQQHEQLVMLGERLTQAQTEVQQLQGQLDQEKVQQAELLKEKQQAEEFGKEQQSLVLKLLQDRQKLEEEIQELVQRQRLLVAFPELNPVAWEPPQSTGDLLGDMEQQIQANTVRIKVLEKENAGLCGSLTRLRDVSQLREVSKPHIRSLMETTTTEVHTVQRSSSQESLERRSDLPSRLASTSPPSRWQQTHLEMPFAADSPGEMLSSGASSSSSSLHTVTVGLPANWEYSKRRTTARRNAAMIRRKR